MSTPQPAEHRVGRRMSSAARRHLILDAAITEFARGGYWGTSTETIGQAAGVSQPYVMRIFGTKATLFRLAFDRALETVTGTPAPENEGSDAGDGTGETSAAPSAAAEPAAAPGLPETYDRLVSNHDAMMVLLHGFAHGATEAELGGQARAGLGALYSMTLEASGGDAEQASVALSRGLLTHVLLAMDSVGHFDEEPLRAMTLSALEPPMDGDTPAQNIAS